MMMLWNCKLLLLRSNCYPVINIVSIITYVLKSVIMEKVVPAEQAVIVIIAVL